MAYRINVGGGIVPIRLSDSIYSSFTDRNFVSFLLKVRNKDVRLIRLINGDRIAVRAQSFAVKTDELYNEKATKLLHEMSYQKTAVIKGPAIVIKVEDWNE